MVAGRAAQAAANIWFPNIVKSPGFKGAYIDFLNQLKDRPENRRVIPLISKAEVDDGFRERLKSQYSLDEGTIQSIMQNEVRMFRSNMLACSH